MSATSKRIETDRVIAPGQSYGSLDDLITKPVLTPLLKTPLGWFLGFGLSAALLMLFLVTVYVLITTGMGIFGNNQPVAWAFPIINLVWWIGIGHAGTMISAILLLVRQDWRTSINRFAEAMTLFAVACAGLFPILHLGRPWVFYWLLPYPNTMDLWPQFRSPLAWDVFAITAYASVSALFWFIGLLPDLATLRDRAQHPIARLIYGALSLGWRGSAKHWQRYTRAYLLLAALAAPLVVSVHTTISFDFAVTQVPGWNNTIMAPYFVAGALYAGFAMVLILAIPLRKMFGFEGLITLKHLDNSAKVMLATGLFVAYGYVIELFIGWYSGTEFERFMVLNRLFGDYTWAFWTLIAFNVLAIQPLWFRSVRRTPWALFLIAILVSIGMWLERFVIISVSLSRDFMTSAWHNYQPTTWDFALFLGSIGLFLTLWFLFLRFLPAVASTEVKELVHHTHHHAKENKA